MCGLAGVVRQQGGVVEASLGDAATTLLHRGPDAASIWINRARSCGLGHTRLSIIDVVGGRQPLSSPDGSVHAIVNGEFYGFEAIRQRFTNEGYCFASKSDSEILIPLYLKHGTACLKHLRGEFAFVLWGERNQPLFCGGGLRGVASRPFPGVRRPPGALRHAYAGARRPSGCRPRSPEPVAVSRQQVGAAEPDPHHVR
jgi:asparagine synthase (glutamine-hydrolysing)